MLTSHLVSTRKKGPVSSLNWPLLNMNALVLEKLLAIRDLLPHSLITICDELEIFRVCAGTNGMLKGKL
jgi:hypothetical protein